MWDIKSVILYLVMASIGYFCISEERRSIQNGVRRRLKVSYAILFFVWLFLAVYRYVGYESGIIIGGNDAPTYIDYFQTCLAGKGNNIYFVRTEPLFQIMTKAVRTITSNYHVYFALIYGLIIFSYLRFIDEFDLLQSNKTPLFMLVFPFIQSFCAIRTHITIALILLAIVALKNRRNILMWGLLIASVFIQRASLIYAIFPIFYFYYKKNKMCCWIYREESYYWWQYWVFNRRGVCKLCKCIIICGIFIRLHKANC